MDLETLQMDIEGLTDHAYFAIFREMSGLQVVSSGCKIEGAFRWTPGTGRHRLIDF